MPEGLVDRLFALTGKTAVVTGGSRGIGLMIARGFLEAGVARVHICARKEAELQAAADELRGLQLGEVVATPADLATLAGVEAFAKTVSDREERLHILVNNAGAAWGAPLDEFPESGFDKVIDTNVKGVFFLTQKMLPLLRAAATSDDPARVINIGSVDGLAIPLTPNYPYSASKAAVHMLTRHLAHALVGDHVNVNAIAPGLFPTRMTKWFFEGESENADIQLVPMKRAGGPDDAAGAAIYLAARASAYVTGAVVPVSGGLATIDRQGW